MAVSVSCFCKLGLSRRKQLADGKPSKGLYKMLLMI